MRLYPIVLCMLLCSNVKTFAQSDPYFILTNESPAQRVTNKFIFNLSVPASDTAALKKAVRALEAKGLYDKLLSLNIGKYFINNKCYNLLIPDGYNGDFTLTIKAGTPQLVTGGIRLKNGDQLNTHFVNDNATKAPAIGSFWYTDIGVDKLIVNSNSPFKVEPRSAGKAFINVWNSPSGIAVPPTPAGFCMAQRVDSATVEFFQGNTKYSKTVAIGSQNPLGNETFIQGNIDRPFVLKAFGFTEALTQQQVTDLKQILDQLITDLGL